MGEKTMEYYTAIKKNELDLDTWTWKYVHMLLSEKSQLRYNKHNTVWSLKIVKLMKTKSKMVTSKGLGEGKMGSYC